MKVSNKLTFIAFTLFSASAFAQNPYAKPDNSWISIHGTVTSVSADEFELDYGDGLISVEMDDGDRDADGYKLVKGDEVRVSGTIDDDFYKPVAYMSKILIRTFMPVRLMKKTLAMM